jgi:hypothetical protein
MFSLDGTKILIFDMETQESEIFENLNSNLYLKGMESINTKMVTFGFFDSGSLYNAFVLKTPANQIDAGVDLKAR